MTLLWTGLAIYVPDLEVINLSLTRIVLESIEWQASKMRSINLYLSVLVRTEDFSETDFCDELFFI